MYDLTSGHRITGQYGEDRKTHKHKGVDIAYPMNADLLASAGGKVNKIGYDPTGYGKYIDILSDNGLTLRYAHANDFNVKLGDLIKEGQRLGRVGSTGRSTGSHVHLETLLNGRNINPMEVIKNPNKYLKKVIGTPKKQDLAPIIQEAAQNYMQQKVAPNPLEERVNDIMLQSLQDVPKPEPVTSIQDIFSAKSGDRFGTLLDYLSSPQGSQLLGNTIAAINPKMEGMGERVAIPKQKLINQKIEDYEKAKENQTKLAQDLLNTQFGLKSKEFEFGKEKFKTEQDYKKARDKVEDAFKNRELSQKDYELQIKALDSKADRELTKAQIAKIGFDISGTSKKQNEEITNINKTAKDLQDFHALFNAPGIKQFKVGIGSRIAEPLNVGLRAANIKNPDEVAFDAKRAMLFSNIARNLGGEKGVLSDGDIKRIGMAMPTLSDDPQQKEVKMQEIYKIVDNALEAKGMQPYFKNTQPTESKIKSVRIIK